MSRLSSIRRTPTQPPWAFKNRTPEWEALVEWLTSLAQQVNLEQNEWPLVDSVGVLTNDGFGILTWQAAAAGGVTAVTGTLPITSSGGATPDIAINDFTASGVGHTRGSVPDPGAVAGTTKFLREDATFAVPPDTVGVTAVTGTAPIASSGGATPDISIATFVGSGVGHDRGAVPDPGAVAGTTKFLREDATFAVPAGGTPSAHAPTHVLDGSDVVLTPLAPAGNVTIPNGYGWYVPGGSFEIAAGMTLELGATAVFEIGG